jgi:hypothetical protein
MAKQQPIVVVLMLVATIVASDVVLAQGFGRGAGRGRGPGMGRGPGGDTTLASDQAVFHYLLEHHAAINREVTELPNGVRTRTTSADAEVASKIREHVAAMHERVVAGRGLRYWDPLFAEIFKYADKIEMEVTDIEGGVEVVETSSDAMVARLIKAHAKVVSNFAKRGFDEARLAHPVPDAAASQPVEGELDATVVALSRDFDAMFIPALALTSQQKAQPALRAAQALATFVEQHQAAGDRLLAPIQTVVTKAVAQIEAGKIAPAHETLEGIRNQLAAQRRAMGVDYPLDRLTDFHEVMEAIVAPAIAGGKALDDDYFANLPGLATEASHLWAQVEQTSFAKIVADTQQLQQLDKLVSAERQALVRLNRAIRDGQRDAIVAAAADLKPPFAKLYMSFGNFGQ